MTNKISSDSCLDSFFLERNKISSIKDISKKFLLKFLLSDNNNFKQDLLIIICPLSAIRSSMSNTNVRTPN